MAKKKSIEPNISQLGNTWLAQYCPGNYKLEQEPLNDDIDRALDAYVTKNGGGG